MDKIVGLLVILFIVAVSGQDYVVTAKQEVHHQMPSRMINKLVIGIQKLSAAVQNGTDTYPCLVCKELLTFAYNVRTDKAFLLLLQNFGRQFACTYLIPSGFNTFCENYIDDIPDLVGAFANSYLNPNQCAWLCNSPEVDQPLNIVTYFMGRALKDGFQ